MAKKLNYKLEPQLTVNESPLAVNESPLAEENNPLQGVGTERLQQEQDSQPEVKGKPEPSGYDRILQAMYPVESAEERARREKRQARERLFAGIGDAVSAISNMYAATQGVPSTYNPQTTMSASVQRRHDRINAERDKDRLAWNNAALSRDRLDLNRQREERLRSQLEANAMKSNWQREIAEGKLDVAKMNAETKKAYTEGRISHQEFLDLMTWVKAQGTTKVTRSPKGTSITKTTPNVWTPSPDGDRAPVQSAVPSSKDADSIGDIDGIDAFDGIGNSGRSGSVRNSGRSANGTNSRTSSNKKPNPYGTTKKKKPY